MNNIDLDKKQKFQEAYYKNMAEQYDKHFHRENPNHIYKIETITENFFRHFNDPGKKYSFLEIGGGTGIHANYFLSNYANRISRYMLTDLSPEMLEQAKHRLAKFGSTVDYLATPAEKLKTDERFDGVFMSGAMHHFSDPYQSLIEFKEHLNKNGMLIVCEPIITNPYNFVHAISTGTDWGQFHVTRSNIRKYLKQLNYKIIEDRILHYKSNNKIIKSIFPYKQLEKIKLLDSQAIMFLFASTLN